MKGKKSFVIYTSWRSYFELMDDPELIKELLYNMFDIAEGKETAVTNNRVKSALKAIEPKMREDFEAYEARCEKNRKAAQKRWAEQSDMQTHANAMQMDGDIDTDTDIDIDTDTETDIDADISAMPCQDAPSVADVLEACKYRNIDMSEEDAQAFIDYFYRDRKGLIDGEPIRNWRNLLKTWDDHTIVPLESVMESSLEAYDKVYCNLSDDVQESVDRDQEMFNGDLTKATAKLVTGIGKAV